MKHPIQDSQIIPARKSGIAQADLDRREIHIHDMLVAGLKARGHEITQPRDHLGQMAAGIRGECVSWYIRERHLRRKVAVSNGKKIRPGTKVEMKNILVPSGFLSITIIADFASNQTINEKYQQLLEQRIDELLTRFEDKAAHAALKRNEREDWERRWRERKERQARRRLLESREESRWGRFLQNASDWREAAHLREFVDVVAERMREFNERPARVDLWLEWARERIRDLDPIEGGVRSTYDRLIAKPRHRVRSDYEIEFGVPDPDEEDFL